MPGIETTTIRRVSEVTEWLVNGMPTSEIIATILEKQWCKSDRQAYNYIKKAKQAFVEETSESIHLKRQKKLKELYKLRDSLKAKYRGTPMGMRAILSVEKVIIRLEGLEQPIKVQLDGQVEHNHTHTHEVDYSKLSDAALMEIAAQRKLVHEVK